MNSFYVYILQSLSSQRFYIGQTHDVQARLIRHNNGAVTATRNKGPWILKAVRTFASRAEAMAEERRLKAMKSSHVIRRFIEQFPPPPDCG